MLIWNVRDSVMNASRNASSRTHGVSSRTVTEISATHPESVSVARSSVVCVAPGMGAPPWNHWTDSGAPPTAIGATNRTSVSP